MRFTAVVLGSAMTPTSGSRYDLQASDDGKIFVIDDNNIAVLRINDSLPVGFRFGAVGLLNGDSPTLDSASGLDHFWDAQGDALNAYGTTANPGGMFVEVVKVASHTWQAIAKTGNWAAT
jgi:hypothetical protein